MILFAKGIENRHFAVSIENEPSSEIREKLAWLLTGEILETAELKGHFIGPRKEMLTPWSTNAVEITQNMGINGIVRIEEFFKVEAGFEDFDKMLQVKYDGLSQDIFTIDATPAPIVEVDDIKAYNEAEGLALNEDEVEYLVTLSQKLNRKLTDSEVFGFSQVNSEHCRHKIFNGTFVIDGEEMPSSLFKLIRKTTEIHKNQVVSAYKDNVAFIKGPKIEQFAPQTQDKADYFKTSKINSVLSIKAETHNFPTTVEPFNGAATGAGGEIRDRLAGGTASTPLAGTAVYMTPYSRISTDKEWENKIAARNWLYQTPVDLLIKASNGASDFGNKFGQPLICGSVLTFEHEENNVKNGFDKVIMLAGGIGTGKYEDALKKEPKKGDKIIILGGDNYRIGMGGSAVSSVDTGQFSNSIELNAIQRSNPEMQKRVANAIRAMSESEQNPIVSIHDHGAGGHLNCLSELVEDTGGKIDIKKLPVGDPTLSYKEIVGNESQERMGLVINDKDIDLLKKISKRERAPFYEVGEASGDHQFIFEDSTTKDTPINLKLSDMFGNPPKTKMEDKKIEITRQEISYDSTKLIHYIEQVLRLEAVACKDWLTNKVDRSVTGKVAKQQTCGEIQLPLNNLGVSALDFKGKSGLATSIGHAPVVSLIDEAAGSRIAIAESLTNIIWAPLTYGIQGVSLSANWMWPCKNEGEDARLYNAVKAVSDFSIELGINVPTGKDSLSMTQKYPNGDKVIAPGTVIISAGAEVNNVRHIVSPNLINDSSALIHIDFSGTDYELGGSSFAQALQLLGNKTPDIKSAEYFKKAFASVQDLIENERLLAGHDISAGGLITALLEMTFTSTQLGLDVHLDNFAEQDIVKLLFSENPGVLIQVPNPGQIVEELTDQGIKATYIADIISKKEVRLNHNKETIVLNIDELRDRWYETSFLLDSNQTQPELAKSRFDKYKEQPLSYRLPNHFSGKFKDLEVDSNRTSRSNIKAAIIREKGVNGDREMAYILHLAGFDVKDVHMTDLVSGAETLEDINFIVFVGGFSNSDVLGSAKGWAGAFLFNPTAKQTLDNFFAREDTMSLGVCNGCQLMVELGLISPRQSEKPKMLHNDSGKFESAYLNVNIPQNESIMLSSLSGSRLGIWVAHGEGKFSLPAATDFETVMLYSYSSYPGNPNGSDGDVAGIASQDGRHLAMMPHLERAFFPWQCAHYPEERLKDDCTPWLEAFVNAKNWVAEKIKS